MARMVVCRGVLYDADRLPPNVDASECVPEAEWFAQNRQVKAALVEPVEPVEVAGLKPRKSRRGRVADGD